MLIEFTVPGIPVPKGRPRVMRGGWTFTPKKTIQYENLVKMVALARRQTLKLSILEGSFRILIVAYGAHPLSDWDNIGKAISDALNGVLWKDDRYVIDARVMKLPCAKGQERTEVKVESI